jgi:hypothetical protein
LTQGNYSRQNESDKVAVLWVLGALQMKKRLLRIGLGIAAMLMLACVGAIAQDSDKKDSADTRHATPTTDSNSKKPAKKLSLTDVTKISTEDAARSAAHEAATGKSKKEDTTKDSEPVVDSITEFSPAPPESKSSSTTGPKVSTKSSKSKIHGEAYGSTSPTNSGNRQTGGAVGTTSKSGKTSVYVQGEQSRSSTPTPH